ncbi:hypothetical protein Tco_0689976 [Tanacetum coccineum]
MKIKVVPPNLDEGTDKPKVSTDQLNGSTDKLTAEPKNVNSDENATPTVFRDDETIVEFLVSMSQNKAKQKGVEIKDAEDSIDQGLHPTRSVLTLKPIPRLILKIRHEVIDEEAKSEAESERVNKAERKFAQLANDEEIARKLQGFKEKEREKFTFEERAKLLHGTIAAQRRFLAQQKAVEIRSRPPTRTQLRNQMMTYLKHVGGKKHSDLKTKNFEEIQDERIIKDVNKKANGTKKDDSIKEERKEEESTRKRKLGTKKKIKPMKRRFRQDTSQDDNTDSEKENDELRLCLTIAPDEDKEVDYEILDKKYQDEIPKDFDRVLWGDLMIMFNPCDEDEFWNSQQDWNVYPLRKKVLVQMLELKLESEEDNTMALELIRFVKKLIAELEPENSDGNEKDL